MPSPEIKPASPFPSVDAVLNSENGALATARFGRAAATAMVRATLDRFRAARSADSTPLAAQAVAKEALARLITADTPGLRPVFNLTGTVLHTNLGRAILPEAAIEAVTQAMRHAVNLEYDIATGKRGERDDQYAA
jgi:L-seryl-tRNA(Ser) seleniumtransferase